MRKRVARNISLPVDLEHFVLRLVESGRYATASEVVRAALRLLERDEQSRGGLGSAPHAPPDRV